MKNKLHTTLWQRIWGDKARLLYFAGGITLLVVFFYAAQLWAGQRESLFLTVGTIGLIVGSVFLLYRGVKSIRRGDAVVIGEKKPTITANSCNIYVKKDKESGRILPSKIAFELIDTEGKVLTEAPLLDKPAEMPDGQPWQCLNDGNWYYLNYFDLTKGKLRPFALPDSQYFDPAEFGNVIMMPAHKLLFERRLSLLQRVGPWVMVLAFLISIFGILVAGG